MCCQFSTMSYPNRNAGSLNAKHWHKLTNKIVYRNFIFAQTVYLANSNCWLGLFVPGPVGLHRIVYISCKIQLDHIVDSYISSRDHKRRQVWQTLVCSLKSNTHLSCFILHICKGMVKEEGDGFIMKGSSSKSTPTKAAVVNPREINPIHTPFNDYQV